MSFITLAIAALAAVAQLASAAPLADFHGHARRAHALAARDCASVPDVDPTMRDIVFKEAVAQGVNYNLMVTVMETILTESNCNNLNCGDRQSHGLFQQQAPGFGWGTVAQTMDPIHATDAFLACAKPAQKSQPGLSPDELAQFCQQAQAGNRYAQNFDRAVQLINAAHASTGVPIPGSSSKAPSASSSSAAAAPAASAGGSANVESVPGSGACAQTYTPVAGDTCSSVSAQFSIGLDEFYALNQSIDAECSNMEAGVQYCVAAGAAAPAAKVSAAAAPASGSVNVESAPGSGACGRTYTPVAGDTCAAVASAHHIALKAFYALNTSIDGSCSNLDVGVAYCVAASTASS